MTTKDEAPESQTRTALKLALKDLERSESAMHKARAIIREALNAPLAQSRSDEEQPAPVAEPHKQQEPVGQLQEEAFGRGQVMWFNKPVDQSMLYTSPPIEATPLASQRSVKPWVGLTQQDIDIAFDDTQEGGGFDEFARAIEAKLKEKNQ